MTNKKLPGFGIALLMAVSISSAYAEEWDMTQERTQQRLRTDANLQTSDSEHAQTRTREQRMEHQDSQSSNEYRSKYRAQQSSATSGSMARQNWTNRSIHRTR